MGYLIQQCSTSRRLLINSTSLRNFISRQSHQWRLASYHWILSANYSTDDKGFSERCTATVPPYDRHLVLHDECGPEPSWPSDLKNVSALYEKITQLTRPNQPLAGLGVSVSASSTDPSSNRFTTPEAYLHSAHETIKLPFVLYNQNLEEFVDFYQSLPKPSRHESLASYLISQTSRVPMRNSTLRDPYHVYVCVHESRDCRCGTRGKPLLKELMKLYDERDLLRRKSNPMLLNMPRLQFYPISHVGGHKHAANLLVYPSGHWYGLLDPAAGDAERILDTLLNLGTKKDEIWWERWRGQIGLGKETQQDLHDWGIRKSLKAKRRHGRASVKTGPSTLVHMKTFDGQVLSLEGKIGEDLRTIAKRGNAPAIEATCEGNCECATCQIYLDVQAPVPPPSEDEEDMLFTAIDRRDDSRLACQIILTQELAYWLTNSPGTHIRLPRF